MDHDEAETHSYGGFVQDEAEMNTLSDADFLHFTRFEFDDIQKLGKVLGVLDTIYTRSGYAFDTLHAMFLLCARLAWPSRQKTFAVFFGWSQSSISNVLYGCWILLMVDGVIYYEILIQD